MQNLAFIVIVLGLLLLCGEAIWLGKVYVGVAGAVLFLSGLAELLRLPHDSFGIYLLAAAVLCYGLEAAFRTYLLAGIAATILLAYGFLKLLPAPFAIAPEIVLPVTAAFGAVMLALFSIAKRARRNKRMDC